MDLETMPRHAARPAHGRTGVRRAAALAGLLLAAAALTACGDGDKAASDKATSPAASSTAPAAPTASPSPGASGGSASPSATVPGDPSATTPGPRPATPTAPPTAPTPAATPPNNGIAVGEPAPVAHQAITYRIDGSRLTVWFYGGICEKYGLKADESKPGRVDVRVVVTQPMPAGQACAELAKRQTVTVDLKQPLTGRAVTDISTGQLVPLEADAFVGPNPDNPDVSGR
ncbi:hypothetical protein ACWEQL_02355 [Kitasatospora sp. NPDC004240]